MLRLEIVVVLLCLTGGCLPAYVVQGVMDTAGKNCGMSQCTDARVASEGTFSENRPAPSSMQTDAETARIASLAWLAAEDGNCPRALEALEVVATRDPTYFAHLALDPTFAACRA